MIRKHAFRAFIALALIPLLCVLTAVAADDVTAFAGWELPDGTTLCLVNTYGQNVVCFFCNEPRLLQTG